MQGIRGKIKQPMPDGYFLLRALTTLLGTSPMSFPDRPIAFVLAATNHGSMIVNRNDYNMIDSNSGYGVGYDILNQSNYASGEVNFVLALLSLRRHDFGNGVIAIDGGANIGIHSVEWARHMHGWGEVFAFEAQEAIFYALAGNLALNNCLNAHARLAAIGEHPGMLPVPRPNYYAPASFGSLELRSSAKTEYIGQPISYAANTCDTVPMISIDSLNLPRLDLLKIDVEGMELEVLQGARKALATYRPIVLAESIKTDRVELIALFSEFDYQIFQMGMNTLAIHESDPSLTRISEENGVLSLRT